MDQCPVCGAAVRPVDRACACGEVLQPWRTVASIGAALRQRGLALAEQTDYLGACLAFVEASLSNPLDQQSLLDAARALARLGRADDALQFLRARSGEQAQALAAAIEGTRAAGMAEPAADQSAAAGSDAEESVVAPPAPPSRRPLGLPPLPRKKSVLAAALGRGKAAQAWWQCALEGERDWHGDWPSLAAWLAHAPAELTPGLADYVRGVGCFLAADDDAAAQWFHRSIENGSPFLNPVAWWLYLHAEGQDPGKSADWLATSLTPKELRAVCDAVRERLGDRLTAEQLDAIERQAGCAPPRSAPKPAQGSGETA